MQRAMLSPLTAVFVMDKDGMAVPTTPTIAVQSRGPLGFREHYRGNDHDHAARRVCGMAGFALDRFCARGGRALFPARFRADRIAGRAGLLLDPAPR